MSDTDTPRPRGEIIVYQAEDGGSRIRVLLEGETVWLTQNLMAELYQTTRQNISQHIQNVYGEGELAPEATVKKYLTVRQEGSRSVNRLLDHYNLDMVIAVGYRVKSGVATRFRQWATARLREYLVKGFTLDDERLKGGSGLVDYFDELLARVREAKPFAALATSRKRKDEGGRRKDEEEGRRRQGEILGALRSLPADRLWRNRPTFLADLRSAFSHSSFILPPSSLLKSLLSLSDRDDSADPCTDNRGHPEPDPDLRDYENVPLGETIDAYMRRDVLPHVPDAWVDDAKTKVGYEINFNRYFYHDTPPRPLEEIERDLKAIEAEIAQMLAEVTE